MTRSQPSTRGTSALALDPDILTFRQYRRVSFDESGRERSNDEQGDDNADALARSGGRWVDAGLPPYSDVGSASRYARRERLDWAGLLDDIRSDSFGAHGLQLWESSRGSRRVSEWLTLLDLCADHGIKVLVTTHGPRLYDPTNDRDWRSLIEDAVDAEYESRKTSKRVRRSMGGSAKRGAAHGGRRAFGYEPGGVKNSTEAAIVDELVERALAGESIRSLAADLNRRGVKTSAGNDWHPGPLRKMLMGPRIAGLRVHNGVVVAKGAWPALVDEVTHRRLVAMLTSKERPAPRGPSPWELTGFLRCEFCGATLSGNTDTRGVRRYVCRRGPGYPGCGRLVLAAAQTEQLLGLLVTERLADVEARRAAGSDVSDQAERDELARIEAERIELADAKASGAISMAMMLQQAAAYDRRQKEIEQVLAAKVRQSSAALDFIAAKEFVGRGWDALDRDERRLVYGALLDHVTVGPSSLPRGSTSFDTSRVAAPGRIVWKA